MMESKTLTPKLSQDINILCPLMCMIFITLDLMSYLYVYFIVDIHHFIVSCSVFFFTATYILADIIVEVYGYKLARRLIWYSLICEFIFSLFIYFLGNIHLHPEYNNNINTILSKDILRIFLTSVITSPLGDFVNSIAMSRWKVLLKGRYFIMRVISSSSLGIIVYCITAQSLLFLGVIGFKQLAILIVSSILFKVLFVSLCAIPARFLTRILKKIEKSDPYDYSINYNPFKLN